MDDIDAHTWVIEPKRPRRSDTHRRIVVAPYVSLKIHVSPAAPRSVCGWRFYGSERYVASLRDKMRSALSSVRVTANAASEASDSWRVEDGVLKNLERLLCMKLPENKASTESDYALECGISTATTSKEVKWARAYAVDVARRGVRKSKMRQSYHRTLLSGCVRWYPRDIHSRRCSETARTAAPYPYRHHRQTLLIA